MGGGLNYTNLALFNAIFKPQTYENIKNVQALSGTVYLRQKPRRPVSSNSTDSLKAADSVCASPMGQSGRGRNGRYLHQQPIHYLNASYRELLGEKTTLFLAAGWSNNADSITFDGFSVGRGDDAFQVKSTISYQASDKVRVKGGAENWTIDNYQLAGTQRFESGYNLTGSFVEADIFITNDLAGRVGVRHEYTDILQEHNVAPRLSLAYKIGENSQLGAAYGDFYQVPQRQFLYVPDQVTSLIYEKATHYILNFQTIKDDRTFRVEVYQKDYDHLISFHPAPFRECMKNCRTMAMGMLVVWTSFTGTERASRMPISGSPIPSWIRKEDSWIIPLKHSPLLRQIMCLA